MITAKEARGLIETPDYLKTIQDILKFADLEIRRACARREKMVILNNPEFYLQFPSAQKAVMDVVQKELQKLGFQTDTIGYSNPSILYRVFWKE